MRVQADKAKLKDLKPTSDTLKRLASDTAQMETISLPDRKLH